MNFIFQKPEKTEFKTKYQFNLPQLVKDNYTSIYQLSLDSDLSYGALRNIRITGAISVSILRRLQSFFKSDLNKYLS